MKLMKWNYKIQMKLMKWNYKIQIKLNNKTQIKLMKWNNKTQINEIQVKWTKVNNQIKSIKSNSMKSMPI